MADVTATIGVSGLIKMHGGDGVSTNVWLPPYDDVISSSDDVFVGQFPFEDGTSLLGNIVSRGFFDLSALPTGTFLSVRLYGSVSGGIRGGYSGDVFFEWDTDAAPTDSSDFLPIPASGDMLTVDVSAGTESSFTTIPVDMLLDETAFTNIVYAFRATHSGDMPHIPAGSIFTDPPGEMEATYSLWLDVTYHVVDDGGTSALPRPGTPEHNHPTPGSGLPPAAGGGVTVNHRTPPEMAQNALSGRNTPDIRISTNLRVGGARRVVAHE